MMETTKTQGVRIESKAIDDDISCSSSRSLRSYLDDALSVSCSGASATTRTKDHKHSQHQHQRHRVKFDDDDADGCDSVTGGSVRSGNSGTSLLSTDYSTYEQAQEERKIFHRNDRWSTSSSACSSPSSTRSISPSPVRSSSSSSSSRRVVVSPSMCSMPVRTMDCAYDGDDGTDETAIYYCPLTSSVSSEAQTKKEKAGAALRGTRRRSIARRSRMYRENKWMASSSITEQAHTSSTSSVCSYSSSSTTSSTSTSSDLPPRMPRRRSLM